MAGKPKFQIFKILDERIKRIVTDINEYEPEFASINLAFILGFHCGNASNYVGLTSNLDEYFGVLDTMGLAYFKCCPSVEDIVKDVEHVKKLSSPEDEAFELVDDKIYNLFIIYFIDNESQVCKKIFDSETGSFLESQPKLSVLDESKIYSQSAMTKFSLSLKLNILDSKGCLLSQSKITEEINRVMDAFTKGSTVHLTNSNFSIITPMKKQLGKMLTKTLYDHLEVPNEVLQMSDYLPQLTKADKEKLIEKWRNKITSQKNPLDFTIEHESLSCSASENLNPEVYNLNLEFYLYLHLNDSLNKSLHNIFKLIQGALTQVLRLVDGRSKQLMDHDEIKSCTFKPARLGHFVYCMYAIPSNSKPDYSKLQLSRKKVHSTYLAPFDWPQFRFSQRITSLKFSTKDERDGYICNVHSEIVDNSSVKGGMRTVIQGNYTYHHYMQNHYNDNGWGCAYRSLQTIISWFMHQGYINSPDVEYSFEEGDKTGPLRQKLISESRVPTHEEIQTVLVDVGDKQANFIGSQKWIGSQEVCYVLNHLYNLDSKFISVSSGSELVYKARELGQHFSIQSTPIMIGGGVLAHTIIGIDFNEKNGDVSYLILDPHYTGSEDLATIIKKGWCGWKKNSFWDKNAFYNLCLPQRPAGF